MTLQPAYEHVLECDGVTVTLRSSLRAAVAIVNMPGGFAGAYEGLRNQSFAKIRAVILATATDQGAGRNYLARLSGKPLSRFMSAMTEACLAVLAALLQPGDDAAENSMSRGSNSEKVTIKIYFASFYDLGTGWLSWSPADTWAASPAEIAAAFKAHTDRLMKLTPGLSGSDNDQASEDQRQANIAAGLDPDFDRAGLQRLKAIG